MNKLDDVVGARLRQVHSIDLYTVLELLFHQETQGNHYRVYKSGLMTSLQTASKNM